MPGLDLSREFVPLAVAVVTISDTRTLADDRSGDTLVAGITEAGHTVPARSIVQDDMTAIRHRVESLVADAAVDVVITTGGSTLR